MHTILTSMTSSFYFEFIASFECKTLTILKMKFTRLKDVAFEILETTDNSS